MSYQEYKAAQEAEAMAWLESMKAELADSNADADTYGVKKGYEVASGTGETETTGSMDIFTMLAVSEIDAGYWGESGQDETMIEQAGQFNVVDLDRWTKGQKRFHPVTGEQVSVSGRVKENRGNFSAEHAQRAWALIAKQRGDHGYGKAAKARKVRKVSQAQRRLALLQNKAAAADARKARA